MGHFVGLGLGAGADSAPHFPPFHLQAGGIILSFSRFGWVSVNNNKLTRSPAWSPGGSSLVHPVLTGEITDLSFLERARFVLLNQSICQLDPVRVET